MRGEVGRGFFLGGVEGFLELGEHAGVVLGVHLADLAGLGFHGRMEMWG